MSGCESASVPLSPGSLERLSAILAHSGLSCRMVRGLAAVDFRDGCDVYFLRADRQAAARDEDVPERVAAEVLAEFARIDDSRMRLLTAIRSHAADHGIALKLSASGMWEMQAGAATTTLDVGPALTRLARTLEPAAALVQFCERNWIPRIDLQKARELLSRELPPGHETPWKDDPEIEPLFGPRALALDCSAAEREDFSPKTAEEFVEGLMPHRGSPPQKVLEEFVARVGTKRFSIDLKTGSADLEFTDGLDCYRVHPRGKRLAALVGRLGAASAVALPVRLPRPIVTARVRNHWALPDGQSH